MAKGWEALVAVKRVPSRMGCREEGWIMVEGGEAGGEEVEEEEKRVVEWRRNGGGCRETESYRKGDAVL